MSSFLDQVFKDAGFTDEEYDRVLASFEPFDIKKGTVLFKKGQLVNYFYIIQVGLIRSYAPDVQGNDTSTRFYSKGEIAMDSASLFLKLPTEEFMEATTDVKGYRIEFSASDQLFHSIEAYRRWGRSRLVQNLYGYKQRRLSLITKSAKERYLQLLAQQPEVIQLAPLKEISSYLGITNSSLSRIRKDLAQG